MSNLRLLRFVSFLSGLRFGLGVWVLFYLRFTDYAGIGLAETVTIVTSFAMEVPTGIAADRLGRKPCLIGAFALELAGYLLLAATGGLAGLLIALFVLQLGKALQSGTFEALLWESLEESDRERDYVRVLGRVNGAQLAAVAVASLAGGFLYRVDPRLPFAAAGIAFGVAAIAALWLREPPRAGATVDALRGDALHGDALDSDAVHGGAAHGDATRGGGLTGDFRLAAAALARAWRLTLPFLLVGACLAVCEEVLDDVLSVEFGFSPQGLGALLALAYVGAAAAARVAHRLERAVGSLRLVFGLALAAAVTLALSPRLGLLAGGLTVLMRYAMRAVHDTVVTGQIVSAAPAAQRATTISLYQALRRLPYVAFAWSVGTVMDRMTARGFAVWFGVVVAAVTLIAWRLSLARGGQARATYGVQ